MPRKTTRKTADPRILDSASMRPRPDAAENTLISEVSILTRAALQ